MSDRSHEIDCNCDHMEETKDYEYTGIMVCINCGRKRRAVMTSPDDFEWEEVGA